MASSPITSWQIDGETMETMRDFIFLGSKITAKVTTAMKVKDTCSLEEKLWPFCIYSEISSLSVLFSFRMWQMPALVLRLVFKSTCPSQQDVHCLLSSLCSLASGLSLGSNIKPLCSAEVWRTKNGMPMDTASFASDGKQLLAAV